MNWRDVTPKQVAIWVTVIAYAVLLLMILVSILLAIIGQYA